jgi:hypothetical protein
MQVTLKDRFQPRAYACRRRDNSRIFLTDQNAGTKQRHKPLNPVSDLHRSGLVQYMFCDLNISRHESDRRQKARSLFSNCIKSISGCGGRWWPQLPSRVKPRYPSLAYCLQGIE